MQFSPTSPQLCVKEIVRFFEHKRKIDLNKGIDMKSSTSKIIRQGNEYHTNGAFEQINRPPPLAIPPIDLRTLDPPECSIESSLEYSSDESITAGNLTMSGSSVPTHSNKKGSFEGEESIKDSLSCLHNDATPTTYCFHQDDEMIQTVEKASTLIEPDSSGQVDLNDSHKLSCSSTCPDTPEEVKKTQPSVGEGIVPHSAPERNDSNANRKHLPNFHGGSPLCIAARKCFYAGMEVLLSNPSSDIHATTSDGKTPLHLVCENTTVDAEQRKLCVRLLLEHEAKINIQDHAGKTALHLAAENKCCVCLDTLLEAGACPSIQDSYGSTALHIATDSEDIPCMLALTAKKCNRDCLGCCNKKSPCTKDRIENMSLRQSEPDYLDQGYSPDTNLPIHEPGEYHDERKEDYRGRDGTFDTFYSPLYKTQSIYDEDPNQVFNCDQYTLGLSEVDNEPGYSCPTPNEHMLPDQRSMDIWGRFFQNVMADEESTDCDDEEETSPYPLHSATRQGDIQRMSEWVDRGVDVDKKDPGGSTPLHVAASEGHIEALRTLLQSGARTYLRDASGLTPFDIAYSRGYNECTTLLAQYAPNQFNDIQVERQENNGWRDSENSNEATLQDERDDRSCFNLESSSLRQADDCIYSASDNYDKMPFPPFNNTHDIHPHLLDSSRTIHDNRNGIDDVSNSNGATRRRRASSLLSSLVRLVWKPKDIASSIPPPPPPPPPLPLETSEQTLAPHHHSSAVCWISSSKQENESSSGTCDPRITKTDVPPDLALAIASRKEAEKKRGGEWLDIYRPMEPPSDLKNALEKKTCRAITTNSTTTVDWKTARE